MTFIAAPTTSQQRIRISTLLDWREAGLNVASTIRVHKLTVLAKDEMRSYGDWANWLQAGRRSPRFGAAFFR